MKRLLLLLTLLAAMTACRNTPADPAATSAHPRWSYRSVIYEMNVRQYTPEGTLRAAMRELPRLQKLGIDVVWLMPVYPIGVLERKGTLGSYYAISDYTAVNPEFGTMEDFDRFLAESRPKRCVLIAFEAQKVPASLFAAHDLRFDALITEKGLTNFP